MGHTALLPETSVGLFRWVRSDAISLMNSWPDHLRAEETRLGTTQSEAEVPLTGTTRSETSIPSISIAERFPVKAPPGRKEKVHS